MNGEFVFSGRLNRKVEFFENVTSKDQSGESIEVENLLKSRMVHRIDAVGDESAAGDSAYGIGGGRLLALAVCKFQMRFDKDIAAKASRLFIRDFDGDWQVVGPFRLLDSRRRYIELRCRKRGED